MTIKVRFHWKCGEYYDIGLLVGADWTIEEINEAYHEYYDDFDYAELTPLEDYE